MHRIDTTTKRLLADPQKRWAWIIYQLACSNRSLAGIAAELGVLRQTIYQVSYRPYPRMEKIIADALDMAPKDLFPERYTRDGLPNRKWGRPYKKGCVHDSKDTRASKARNTQSAKAA